MAILSDILKRSKETMVNVTSDDQEKCTYEKDQDVDGVQENQLSFYLMIQSRSSIRAHVIKLRTNMIK